MSASLPANVMSSRCASRACMAVLASKWALLLINALDDGRRRNGDLLRRVEGISQKMLTQTLRELEALHIVARHDHATVPPHVEYELTELGRSLRCEVRTLIAWVEANLPALRGR